MRKFLCSIIILFSAYAFLFASSADADLNSLILSNPRKAVELLNSRIETGLQKDDYRNVAPDLIHVASVYRMLGNFDDAMHSLLRAREIIVMHASSVSNTDSLMGAYYETMGLIYIGRYMQTRGVSFLNEAITLYAKSGYYHGAATCMKWRNYAFLMINQPDEAGKYLKQLFQWQQINRDPFIVACYNESEGAISELNGDYESAIKLYNIAMNNYRLCGNVIGQSDMYAYTCRAFYTQGDYTSTIEWAEKGSQFAKENGYSGGYYEILSYKIFALSKSDMALAFDLAKSQLDDISRLGLTIHKGIYLTNMISYAEKMNQYETAFKYSRQFLDVFKEAYGLSSEQRIADMTMQMQTENLNLRIENLNTEKQLNERIRHGQQNMIFYFVIALLVLLLISVGNLKKLQFRMFLFRDYVSDLIPLPVFFLAFVVYGFLLLMLFKSPLIQEQTGFIQYLHLLALSAIPSLIITLGLASLPAIWSSAPEKNRSFSRVTFSGLMLIYLLVIAYNLIFGLIEFNLYEILNVIFTYTGLIVVPLFFIVIYIEKVLLRKRTQEAGFMNIKIRESEMHQKPGVTRIRIVSDKSKDVFESFSTDLLLVEGQSNYTKFYFIANDSLKTSLLLMTLKQAESQLQSYGEFIRCHKSNIVNISRVSKVKGNSHGYKLSVPPMEESVTVSKSYINEFNEAFNRFSAGNAPLVDQ